MSRLHVSAWSLVAAAACWGTATAISKRAVDEIAPLTLLSVQLTVSVGLLFVASLIEGRGMPREHRGPLAVLGVLNPGVSYALGLAGLARITASATALLWATEPIMILLMAWALSKQRPTAAVSGCAAVALVGVLLVVAAPDVDLDPIGVALMLAGVAACAIYTVMSGRFLGSSSTLGVILLQQIAALGFAVALLGGVALAGRVGDLGNVSTTAWASALVAGALYYGVAFWLWLRGLRTCSPTVAGLYINLVPVFGVAAAAVLLDERLVGRQWLGAALVIGAVSVLALAQSRRDRTNELQPVTAAIEATGHDALPR
jgi:probable blue pigment (indigoidine) exporter